MLGKRTQIHRTTSMSQLRLPPHTRVMEEPPQTLGPKSCPLELGQQDGSGQGHRGFRQKQGILEKKGSERIDEHGHGVFHQKQNILEKKVSARVDGHGHDHVHGHGAFHQKQGILENKGSARVDGHSHGHGVASAGGEEAVFGDEQSSSVAVSAAHYETNFNSHSHGHGNGCLHTQTHSLHVEDNKSALKADSKGIEEKFAEILEPDDRLKQQSYATTAPLEEALHTSLKMSPGKKSDFVQTPIAMATTSAPKIASSPYSGLAAPKYLAAIPSPRAPKDVCGFPPSRRLPPVLGSAPERQRPGNPFLQVCFNCKRRLQPGRDIYMYRGDMAFCSEECRMQQILWDERQEAAAGSGSKKDIKKASSVNNKSCNSRKTVPAVAA